MFTDRSHEIAIAGHHAPARAVQRRYAPLRADGLLIAAPAHANRPTVGRRSSRGVPLIASATTTLSRWP
jgi:hypothetical protein